MTLPSGFGVYVRDVPLLAPEGAAWGHAAINARRRDRMELAAAMRAQSGELWSYTTPEQWTPAGWRAELELVKRAAREMGARGIIANPEPGWAGQERAARELGAALAATAAEGLGVCVTSFPAWGPLAELVGAAGPAVSGQVQIYGRTAMDSAAFGRWLARWESAWGAARTGIAIAGWAHENVRTQAQYRAYLAMLPRPSSGSVSLWTAVGGAALWRVNDAAAWYRGGAMPPAAPSSPSSPGSPSSPSSPSSSSSSSAGWGWLLLLLLFAMSSRRTA